MLSKVLSASLLGIDALPVEVEVKGQEHVKRALEVVAAGGHNVFMLYMV